MLRGRNLPSFVRFMSPGGPVFVSLKDSRVYVEDYVI